MRVTITANEWNLAAAPTVRRYVSVGSLANRVDKDWRTVLAAAKRLGEHVYTDVPGERSRYCVSASSADRIADAFRKRLDGYAPVQSVAATLGISRVMLHRIVAAHSVPMVSDAAVDARRSTLVHVEAAKAAMLRDLATETQDEASARHGVSYGTMARALTAAGLKYRKGNRRKSWLVPAAVDAAMLAYRTKSTSRETMPQAALRTSMVPSTLRGWLAADGFRQDRTQYRTAWLDPAIVDAVVNKRRAKDVG